MKTKLTSLLLALIAASSFLVSPSTQAIRLSKPGRGTSLSFPLADVTVRSRYTDSSGTAPNGFQTFTLTKQVFTGSTTCSAGGGFPQAVTGVGNPSPHALQINATDSVLLTASSTSDQNGTFGGWVASDGGTFTPSGDPKTICVQGSAAAHTYVANYSPGIVTLDGTCTALKTNFNLGDTVCARVFINPADYAAGIKPLKVLFVDPGSILRGTSANIVADQNTFTFVLPAVNAPPPEFRGSWRALIVDSNPGSAHGGNAFFFVSDPGAPLVDLQVQKDAFGTSVHADGTMQYEVRVLNAGPNAAVNVSLTDNVPTNATFFSAQQISGPAFNCIAPAVGASGTITCTRASLGPALSFNAPGAAVFRILMKINNGVANGTTISNTASVTNTVTEANPGNNQQTANVTVNSGSCSFSAGCPPDVTAAADTICPSGKPGKVVNFATPATVTGCPITGSQTSGSCFEVGTTPVNFSANDGSSLCQFLINITGAAPAPDLTISKTHAGNFTQGDLNRTYTITVTNSGAAASSGAITVTDTLPAGLVATSMNGSNWNCTQPAGPCARNDALGAGNSYEAITLTVNVACNAVASVTNTAQVSGGGESNAGNNTANDSTTINPGAGPPPTITCPGGITKFADSGQLGAAVNPGTPTAGGGCGPVAVTGARSDGKALNVLYPIGTTVITWTAKDSKNATATCGQTIVVMVSSGRRHP